jgi:N-dimethylarginine dimethylaminohydrolase
MKNGTGENLGASRFAARHDGRAQKNSYIRHESAQTGLRFFAVSRLRNEASEGIENGMRDNAATSLASRPRLLMCRPRHFAVSYRINPWMDPEAWADRGEALALAAEREWSAYHRALRANGAAIEFVPPEPALPDLVFTANAAIVLDRRVLLARFRHPERRREEPHFAAAFRALQARGLLDTVAELPPGLALEGAGDCIWDAARGLFWMGAGARSDAAAAAAVEDQFGVRCIALELVNPSYYHLDTAFCALPTGDVIYYPGAFAPAGLARIRREIAPVHRIEISDADAALLAANAVCLGRTLILSSCGEALRRRLAKRGYTVIATPLPAFLRSGGSACCLTLCLDHQSWAAAGSRAAAAR